MDGRSISAQQARDIADRELGPSLRERELSQELALERRTTSRLRDELNRLERHRYAHNRRRKQAVADLVDERMAHVELQDHYGVAIGALHHIAQHSADDARKTAWDTLVELGEIKRPVLGGNVDG